MHILILNFILIFSRLL